MTSDNDVGNTENTRNGAKYNKKRKRDKKKMAKRFQGSEVM